MKNFKKHIALALAILLAVSMVACQQPAPAAEPTPAAAPTAAPTTAPAGIFKAGTYSATGKGNGGDIAVDVTFTEDKITEIVLTAHNETPGISDAAIDRIPAAIIDAQSVAVDAITGATNTSKGIIEAVTNAIVQAGADPASLSGNQAETKTADAVEETADVIVIGGGGAGLAAAVSAHQNGASVIIIEKQPQLGGNTIISGAAYNGADPDRQKLLEAKMGPEATVMNLINAESANDAHKELQAQLKAEYEAYQSSKSTVLFDSPTLHALQTFEGGDRQGDLELIKKVTFGSLDALHWLEGMGMKFTDTMFTVLGGLWPRAHKPEKPLGTGYIEVLSTYVKDNNVTVMLDTKADSFIVEGGKVVGVEATGLNGAKVTLHANKGVILATGGFGRNVEMRQKYNKSWATLDETILSTNHPGATGDGIVMAEAVGANLVGMEYIQLLPMGDPVTGSLSGNIEQGVDTRFFVNKEGNRFVAEDARRDVMTAALYEQTDAYMWVIVDKHSYAEGSVKNNFNESIDELVAAGRAFKADTIEDLAKQINVDPANLQKAVDSFNAGVDAGKDELGRSLFSTKIDTPPYYAGARVPTVHHTMGGVQVNADNQVISTSGQPIPGLFAAGEVTGGTHGSNRLGGNALADIMVNGRAAGVNVLK